VTAIEIFAGAGGLALGASQAGFEHLAIVEIDNHACETIRQNQRAGHQLAKDWPLCHMDVRDFDYSSIQCDVDLLSAGVPCQPFSLGGKGMAHRDRRDMFGEVIRGARELRPKAILIENVRGLLRTSFKPYFDYLLLAIAFPTITPYPGQSWREHCGRLRRRDPAKGLSYDVHVHSVNAADYGVPQWRDRVLIVAFRSDLSVNWRLPDPTHGLDALVWTQWKTGEYWKRHGLDRRRPGSMSRRIAASVRAMKALKALEDSRLPWRTVRDAISDLPSLQRGKGLESIRNHFLNPGARLYEGHSGSLIDEPAKTLKAGSHGVPGGENTLSLGSKSVRYFSVRECARLQTFPDDYIFAGPWTSAMRQVGNAVPVLLARIMAQSIGDHLNTSREPNSLPDNVLSFDQRLKVRKTG